MNRYVGFLLSLGLAVAIGACASAGGGNFEVPDGYEGPVPQDNEFTETATLFMVQAQNAPDDDTRRQFLTQALEEIEQGLQESPENPQVWYLAGQIHANLGQVAQADEAFDRAEEMFPHWEDIDLQREVAWVNAYNAGVQALQAGSSAEAVERMREATEVFDGRPEAHLQLGSMFAQRGDIGEAIEMFREALAIAQSADLDTLDLEMQDSWRQNAQTAAFNLGQLLAADERDQEAEQVYRDYLESYPNDARAAANLAAVLARQGRDAEAGELLETVMSADDLAPEQYAGAGVALFQAGDYVRAAEAFRRALTANPHDRDVLYNLVQALYVRTTELEDEREGGGTAEIDAELTELYPQVLELGQRLESIDPANRNLMAIIASAYRGQADLIEDEAQGNQLRQQAVEYLTAYEQMEFGIDQVDSQIASNTTIVTGTFINYGLEAGATVQIRFTVVGANGSAVGSEVVSVTAPAPEGMTRFETSISTSSEGAGLRYEVVN